MKVLCVNPPIEDFYSTSIRRQPLGLLYIIAAIKKASHDVSLLNCHTPKKRQLPLPGEFNYLKRFIGAESRSFPFKNYYHFGMSFQEIEKRIKESDAEIFFISSLFTTYYEEVVRIIDIIRTHHGSKPVVTGGYHGSLYPEFFLNNCDVDFVITGEGEKSSVQLLDCLAGTSNFENIPSLSYKKSDIIIKNRSSVSNIDDLFPPERSFLKTRDLRAYGNIFISMITSRGCPNNCEFCTGKSLWGKSYRTRSIVSVINEIRECVEQYDADIINLEDDNLFPTEKRAVETLNEIINYKKESGARFELAAMNGISLENLNEDIVVLMKKAGFNEINISLVTYSKKLQNENKRPFDSEKFKSIALKGKSIGMNVRTYFILGLPSQTKDEVADTINFLKGLDVKIFPSVYYDVNRPREEWKVQRSSAFFNETDHLSRDDLIRFFTMCIGPRL